MKKILSAFAAFGLIAGLCAVNADAIASEIERGFISVQTDASEEFTPNMAKITLSVETSDKDITKATEANKTAAKASIEAVKKLLDNSKGEIVKTVSFNVSPEYTYKNNIRTFVQYNARNSYEVTLKDVSKLGKVIQTALSNGANVVSGLNYSLDTNEENCNKLIQKAAAAAKTRANSAASAMGTSVAGVKNINVQCSANEYYQPRYSMKMMTAENAMDSAGAVPTEEGTIKLRAYVQASFFIK